MLMNMSKQFEKFLIKLKFGKISLVKKTIDGKKYVW
nr:MAG TPA: hypothetical protein [Caudoviricetes sp.]